VGKQVTVAAKIPEQLKKRLASLEVNVKWSFNRPMVELKVAP